MLKAFIQIVFTLIFFTLNLSLFARDVKITVQDAELQIPLEGAMIRSWDGVDYFCDKNGNSVINIPDERQVVIRASYPGYETARLVITVTGSEFIIDLRLSGIMESRELVIEASRPGASETRTGRSVAVGAKEIAQTAEIGIIEDVMSTVKLLPGVGYVGLFDAQPSIRGGEPGDMSASLDGFYISNPYHWGGGFSIFDPRMVQSAQLSHGVFSSRYGHTISGLLEITSRAPSPDEIQFELGINTSAANFNISLPLAGKGGILFMGRVTYYDPVIAIAKELSKKIEELEIINSVRTAPYIRSGTITGNYRFLENLELTATGFWGMDGVGVTYESLSYTPSLKSSTSAEFDYTNYQGFLTTTFSWNPQNNMLLKFSAGTGYVDAVVDGKMFFNIFDKEFSEAFKNDYSDLSLVAPNRYQYYNDIIVEESDLLFNVQGRVDYDWELTDGLLVAAGVQEMFSMYNISGSQMLSAETHFKNLDSKDQNWIKALLFFNGISYVSPVYNDLRIEFPIEYSPDVKNKLFATSFYTLTEYNTLDNRLKTELGLRIDHFYLIGKNGFSVQTDPTMNPRLNIDFNILKNRNIIKSFDLTAGTGIFSSVNNIFSVAEEKYNITKAKPSRSWTSVFGTRLEFPESLYFNIEGYYKYVYDRTYIPVAFGIDDLNINPQFDGEGKVWGIDLMLQKVQSRYWDGWLSYSFSWAKYHDPGGRYNTMGISGGNRGDDWYFPSYHRFHNINLVFNFRPINRINIYTRFGFASGVQVSRRIGDGPISYPVFVLNNEAVDNSYFIEKYYWPAVTDENNRTTPSLPMDIKFSIYGNNNTGKTRYELYVAVENMLALLYSAQGNTSFNSYTGEIDNGSNSASYEIPIPIPSFGFKISY